MSLGIRVARYTAQPNGGQLQEIGKLIDQGKVKVVVADTFGLSQVAEAQSALNENHIRGKIVLRVVEQPATPTFNEEDRRLRAYRIWEDEGRPEGKDVEHWHRAGDADATARSVDYRRYRPGEVATGSLVIKFYHSGDQIRGYVRKTADTDTDDTIFPGEEMEPEAAFKLAAAHKAERDDPVFVELVEGVEWNSAWGRLD